MNIRFILERYRGRSTRLECPQCHQHHCFTRYIDTEGIISFPDYVGRCDHENRCGYHYTPKQYFSDNPDAKKLLSQNNSPKNIKVSKMSHTQTPKMQESKFEPYYFDRTLMERTLTHYSDNNFYLFLVKKFGEEATNCMISYYGVGTAKLWQGATVFWQIDIDGRPRDGKIMMYDADTGHRSKKEQYHVNWIHSLMKIDKDRIRQCFFGEHLLGLEENRGKKIAIVESEKTAIIASFYLQEYVWIATGGKDGMFSQADLSVLRGREVVFFPDLGMTDNWRQKAIYLQRHGIKASVYDYLEKKASEEEKQAGLDIADFLLQHPPLEYQLQSVIKRYPCFGHLVEYLQAELCYGEESDAAEETG